MAQPSSPGSASFSVPSSPPRSSRPPKRTAPTFVSDNDPYPDDDEPDPEPELEPETELEIQNGIVAQTVDEEIDELLSDNENEAMEVDPRPETQVKSTSSKSKKSSGGSKSKETAPVVETSSDLMCKWDHCGKELEDVKALVDHVHWDHIGQGKEIYACGWDDCIRKGQKQASRHSLVTHVRAHTGERPYICNQPNCNKTFTRSDALNKHLRSLHQLQTIPPNRKVAPKPTQNTDRPLIDKEELTSTNLGRERDQQSPKHSNRISPPPTIRREIHNIDHDIDVDEVPAHLSISRGNPEYEANRKLDIINSSDILSNRKNTSNSNSNSNSTIMLDKSINELYQDEDLEPVLPRLQERDRFWEISDDDEPALSTIRSRYQSNRSDEDLLDEELGIIAPDPEVIGVTIDHLTNREVPVMSRSQWQMRYMMSKAKMMLLEEENAMRRRDLQNVMLDERQLDEELAAVQAMAREL